MCLLTVSDLQLIQSRILIDCRRFKDYNLCHFKGSFNMSLADKEHLPVYLKFMRAYQQVYPDNPIVILGDE